MNCIFRWIHFSDIHLQTKDVSFNTKQLRDTLPEYLKKTVLDNIDAIIFTGDYRYAPEKDENPQRVVAFLKELASAVKVDDVKKIVTVPGNHDLTRSTTRTYLVQGMQKDYQSNVGTFDQTVLNCILDDFSFYDNFHAELQDAPIWEKTNPHTSIEFPKCNLLLLNTAITAYGDDDRNHLLLGSSYVASKVSAFKNRNPIIAVGHHSFTELHPDECRTITHYLDQQGVHLYLCGHTHDQWSQAFGEKGKYYNVGCMQQTDNAVKASFAIGELFSNGSVSITSHKWDMEQKYWFPDPANKKDFNSLYADIAINTEDERTDVVVKKLENPFSISGYTLLGALGCDGIKYYWEKNGRVVESIALNQRLKYKVNQEDGTTSAYTISTSFGCQLSTTKQQCRFCETGSKSFGGNLTAEDIALQCIFMAEYDCNCPSYPQVRGNAREFAFMGQGEPGYNYPAIKQAIIMNDYVMERLGQTVSRYVISTCGVSGFIPALIQDIKSEVFRNKVTIHLSLHDVDDARNEIMPINRDNDYKEALEYCKALYSITKEKIGVGILMFDQYQSGEIKSRTLTQDRLEKILSVLDNEIFRIDLCAVNKTSVGEQKHQLSNEIASNLCEIAKQKGFEVKLFASFGDSQQSGCGMLSSSTDDLERAGKNTIAHFNNSVSLLHEAKQYYFETLRKS